MPGRPQRRSPASFKSRGGHPWCAGDHSIRRLATWAYLNRDGEVVVYWCDAHKGAVESYYTPAGYRFVRLSQKGE
jgi:hypothetical protein